MTDLSDYLVTGTDNPAKQYSVNHWNDFIAALETEIEAGGARVTPQLFGATGDGVTDDGPAFIAAIAWLKANAFNSDGWYKGSARLYVPPGHYYLGTSTLDLSHAFIFEGDDIGFHDGHASKLRWAANTTGIRTQRTNTTGANSVQAEVQGTTFGADGCIIRNLYLEGGWDGVVAEGEYHGIHTKTRVTIENCGFKYWQGDGIFSATAAGGGVPYEGEANVCQVSRCRMVFVRNGLSIDGADCNIWNVQSLDVVYARQWGILDSSFLGNAFFACHLRDNGYIAGPHTPSTTSHGGNWYTPVIGQEAAASTNAPSGTTADNAYWLYVGAGGPNTTNWNVPAWSSGMTWRAGGPYMTDNANAATSFNACYTEGGQAPRQLGPLTVDNLGSHATRQIGGGRLVGISLVCGLS